MTMNLWMSWMSVLDKSKHPEKHKKQQIKEC